jgi:hypothetical protein
VQVTRKTPPALTDVLEALVALGYRIASAEDAHVVAADRDDCAPGLYDDEPPDVGAAGRRVGAGGTPAHGRRDRDRRWPRRLPGSARSARDAIVCGIRIKIVPEFQDATVTASRSDERDLVGAPRGSRRIAHRGDDARSRNRQVNASPFAGPVVVHTGGGAYF